MTDAQTPAASDALEASVKWNADGALLKASLRGDPEQLRAIGAVSLRLSTAAGAWSFTPQSGPTVTRVKSDSDSAITRLELDIGDAQFTRKEGALFEARWSGASLALCAHDGFRADVSRNEQGGLARLRLSDAGGVFDLDEGAAARQSASKTPTSFTYFSLHKDERGSFFQAVAVPYYYLIGAQKRLDIRGEWNRDFAAAAAEVIGSGATLLAHDRLYSLWQAVRNVAHLDGPIVEVGVLRGGSSKLIAMAQRHFGKNGKIYACDTFTGHAHVDEGKDAKHKVGTFGESARLEDVQALLSSEPDAIVLPGAIEVTAQSIDGEIAMLHLDVDVYPTTCFALAHFFERLAPGGIIIVDDYAVDTCPGVQQSMDEFVAALPPGCASFTHLLSGQALLQRLV